MMLRGLILLVLFPPMNVRETIFALSLLICLPVHVPLYQKTSTLKGKFLLPLEDNF